MSLPLNEEMETAAKMVSLGVRPMSLLDFTTGDPSGANSLHEDLRRIALDLKARIRRMNKRKIIGKPPLIVATTAIHDFIAANRTPNQFKFEVIFQDRKVIPEGFNEQVSGVKFKATGYPNLGSWENMTVYLRGSDRRRDTEISPLSWPIERLYLFEEAVKELCEKLQPEKEAQIELEIEQYAKKEGILLCTANCDNPRPYGYLYCDSCRGVIRPEDIDRYKGFGQDLGAPETEEKFDGLTSSMRDRIAEASRKHQISEELLAISDKVRESIALHHLEEAERKAQELLKALKGKIS